MDRIQILTTIEAAFEVTPVVTILGPKRAGKTSLAKHYIKKIGPFPAQNYFDLKTHET